MYVLQLYTVNDTYFTELSIIYLSSRQRALQVSVRQNFGSNATVNYYMYMHSILTYVHLTGNNADHV